MGSVLFVQVYEPVEEGSYIKMIDMVTGNGGQIQVNPVSIIAYLIYSFHCLSIYLTNSTYFPLEVDNTIMLVCKVAFA